MAELENSDGLFVWILGTKTQENLVSNYDEKGYFTDKSLAYIICGDRNRDQYDLWLDNLGNREIWPDNLYPWLPSDEQTPDKDSVRLGNDKFTGPWYVKQYVFVGPA